MNSYCKFMLLLHIFLYNALLLFYNYLTMMYYYVERGDNYNIPAGICPVFLLYVQERILQLHAHRCMALILNTVVLYLLIQPAT